VATALEVARQEQGQLVAILNFVPVLLTQLLCVDQHLPCTGVVVWPWFIVMAR
jgi:hypothetical protein